MKKKQEPARSLKEQKEAEACLLVILLSPLLLAIGYWGATFFIQLSGLFFK